VKEREIYAEIRTVPPVIIRLDGRAFHQLLSNQNFQKPFDNRFADAMAQVCTSLLTESGIASIFAFTFSDEISLYLTELPFQGRVEKLVSILASYAASALTLTMNPGSPLAFDARVIPVDQCHVIPYLNWRQKEAWRNHINGYCQALLLRDGLSPAMVQRRLNRLPTRELHEICFQHGINLAQTPPWQRRGIMAYHTTIIKEGYNPVTHEETSAIRRKVVVDRDLPLFSSDEGHTFIRALLCEENLLSPP
jgi:tRNA(His) 5'-end guanylyltransferase